MPGIVGLITQMPPQRAMKELQQMVDAIHHLPTYTSRSHVDELSGVYCGSVERTGSFSSEMPLTNETGTLSMMFSGEDFSAPGTVAELRRAGHAIDNNPASYLIHQAEEDSSFPASVNGRFHGLLLDRKTQSAVLFNDRYGMHRIYYHQSAEAFYFAAEAKAILAVCPQLREVDLEGLGELVSLGCVLENRSVFKGIQVLPPASAWTFRDRRLIRRLEYFAPMEWEDQPPLDAEAFYQSIREVFSQRVGWYFGGREKVGVSLTGGLDSRMIMAWRREANRDFSCYSFGGMFRDCQDVSIAREVATRSGRQHQVIPVASEFLSQFPKYAERAVYLTDGCVNVSHSPDLYVNEIAATIAPVRLTGNYGGEVLRRVRAFKPMNTAPGLFTEDFLKYKESGDTNFRRAIQGHPLSFAVFRQAPWHHYGLLSLERTQVSLRSPFLDNAFVKAVFRAPATVLANNDVSLRLIADGDPALGALPTDRGIVYGKDSAWWRARQKAIDFTVKAEYAYDYGMPQWLAKVDRLLSPFRPERMFLGRHKFYHFRYWYRHSLSSYVQDVLLDSKTLSRSFFNRKGLEAMVKGHISGRNNWTLGIHKALSVELMHRTLIDS